MFKKFISWYKFQPFFFLYFFEHILRPLPPSDLSWQTELCRNEELRLNPFSIRLLNSCFYLWNTGLITGFSNLVMRFWLPPHPPPPLKLSLFWTHFCTIFCIKTFLKNPKGSFHRSWNRLLTCLVTIQAC